jgi:hypothetical protein
MNESEEWLKKTPEEEAAAKEEVNKTSTSAKPKIQR